MGESADQLGLLPGERVVRAVGQCDAVGFASWFVAQAGQCVGGQAEGAFGAGLAQAVLAADGAAELGAASPGEVEGEDHG